ncbi:MAG: hypothetical protein A2Z72_04020 [Omnitrophica bacterium RBG_13_46_9]|nr:MAG: hypothetical protein A2Z72_04020 [Omnitrophica bacterium RBG_13_46_9]
MPLVSSVKNETELADIRLRILDIHLDLEACMNRTLSIYAVDNAKKRNVDLNIYDILPKFERFTFYKKITLIDALSLAPNSIGILTEINRLRNTLMHKTYPEYVDVFSIQEKRDVKYLGQVIPKEGIMTRLEDDRKKVIDEFSKNLSG